MQQAKQSLSRFINRRISLIYVIVLMISIPLIYFMSVAQHKKEVETELRNVLAALTRLPPQRVDPQALPRFSDAVTSFLKHHESYFHQYIEAGADGARLEMSGEGGRLLGQFRRDRTLASASGEMRNELLDLVYIAHPWYVDDELAAIEVIGINLKSQNDKILVRVITFIAMVSIIYAIIISSINTALRKHVINPLIRINNRTRSVADGEVSKVFETQRQDEIGELIRSIELLRRSLQISMDLMKQKQNS